MSKLPVLSSLKVIKALAKLGYEIDHKTGSHVILRQKQSPFRRVTVPSYKEVARGTLRAIIRETGLTVEEFTGLL